jgi:hypothetical protein
LMNHAIQGVNSGYITRHKLLENHLRSQQQAISDVIFANIKGNCAVASPVRNWLLNSRSRVLHCTTDVIPIELRLAA